MTVYGSTSSRGYKSLTKQFRELIKSEYPGCQGFITGGRSYDPLPNSCGREYSVVNLEPNFRKYPKEKHGFKAFYYRNKQIAYGCDVLIAFWNLKSKGTKMTIDLAKQFGREVHIWTYKDGQIVRYQDPQTKLV